MLSDAAGALRIAGDEKLKTREDSATRSSDLVVRAQAGETYAFEQLMICYQRQVLCTAARMLHRYEDAKDASQEVFVKLYRYLPRINPGAVQTWLYRVTITVCRDLAKKSRRVTETSLEEYDAGNEPGFPTGDQVETGVDLRERKEMLRRALQSLPFKERAALVLRDVEELSTEETARVLGSSAVTVRTQISSARVKVRRYCERAMRRTG
ncbi:MAG: sigma-70 family RNA polymerase sigma factor [Acidobacteriia bacterium]|nr:sigma-70 family RNA polymerase sigma factor [Terriglobia bacterium]